MRRQRPPLEAGCLVALCFLTPAVRHNAWLVKLINRSTDSYGRATGDHMEDSRRTCHSVDVPFYVAQAS